MISERRWLRGDVVIVRDPLETRGTRVYETLTGDSTPNLPGRPYVVLEDTLLRVALYQPEGTKAWRWNILEQRFRPTRPTQGDSVRLLYPGKPYTVDLFYDTGSGPAPWVEYYFLGRAPPAYLGPAITGFSSARFAGPGSRFYGWKVDIVSPFRRTELGFDICDEVLDIVVKFDRAYQWKDEHQMARFVELGIYTQTDADRLRRAGLEVIELVERGASPFDDEWVDWRPPARKFIPEAPDGWQYLPLADSEWGDLHRRVNEKRE
jgi:hypothetical protein